MALERRHCINHPDRLALGVCIETGSPICGECSTRYDGVNYSREGLEIMHRRRREQLARSSGVRLPFLLAAGIVMTVVAWGGYILLGRLLAEWLRN